VIPAIPSLRILMLAPEPFFEPRGTPFSEYHRIKALVEQGHEVDLVTYPCGADVALPNLRIIRSVRPPFVRRVPIGPSVTKVVLDAFLAVTALRLAMRQRYDAIHSHEEAGLLGVWLSRRLDLPHLYDMHSSLPQQLTNFRFTRSSVLRRLFESAERYTVGGSKVIITICQELQDTVERMGHGDRAVLIENVMGGDVDVVPGPGPAAIRAQWGIEADAPLLLYTGTFEPYQGLDLLLDAIALLQQSHPHARMLIVGGEPAQVELARARAAAVGARVVFTGQRPPNEVPYFVEACDMLVSPRVSGTNTPLKIYSYLRSGRPIVATNLLTHTQVLDDRTAVLVAPEPRPFASALARLIDRPDDRVRIAAAAAELAAARYSREAYLTRTRHAYARLMDGVAPDAGAPLVTSQLGAGVSTAASRRGTKLP
jgi:glycosyltransferase involved in cell wall biosynthesis